MTERDHHVTAHERISGSPVDARDHLNDSRWSEHGDQHQYLDGWTSYGDPDLDNGSDVQMGRHRGGAGRSANGYLWPFDVEQDSQSRASRGYLPRDDGMAPRHSRPAHDPLAAPRRAEPPVRLHDHWPAGYQENSAAPAPAASRSPAVYVESFPVPVRATGYAPASYQPAAHPAVPQSAAVSQPRERIRGMNAALETGVAGVGEMAPARPPARPRQMFIAVLVAVVGLVVGGLTYKSLATGPASFAGEIVPAHVYALSFGGTGTITAIKVRAAEQVTAGEVLATQSDSLARTNLQEAEDAQAAAAAALYVDQHPQQSSLAVASDSVTAAQATLASVTARAASTRSSDGETVSERQQAVSADTAAYDTQCGSASGSSSCQALAAKLATAKQLLAQAQAAAAADVTAGEEQEQAAQSQLSERQAALQQVQSQADGATVTLDVAEQRLAAAKAAVAQDEEALDGTSIVAPAAGTIGAVSVAAGDDITPTDLHNPVLTVDTGPLVVSADLPGDQIGTVRPGQPVTLDIESLNISLPAKVAQINQVASQSQTAVNYTVICLIEARDIQLMAGMTVKITPQ